MSLGVTLLLVVAVHLCTNLAAWRTVGLLADDRFAVGLPALLDLQQMPLLQQVWLMFAKTLPPDQPVALYRPFVDVSYLLEYPLYGVDAAGYHATNSLLHCATAVLWFLLLRRLTGAPFAAAAAAVAFAGWPGHSEATHWISARTNLLSTFWMVLAALVWLPPGPQRSWRRTAAATVCAVIALGCKETAVLVAPLLLLLDWLRPRAGVLAFWPRVRAAVLANLPVWLALGGWLLLRAAVLHTFGIGNQPAWQLDASSPRQWLEALGAWIAVLLAPRHAEWTPWLFGPLLWLAHGALIALAYRWRRDAAGRRVLLLALGFGGCGLLAIVGLPQDRPTLQNVRYTYETALPLAALLGFGLAALPARWQRTCLLLLVVVHLLALEGNRDSWLRAGALRSRYEAAAYALAGRSAAPVRVLDAPSIYHGAFVQLIADPTVFVAPFAPAAAHGKGTMSPAGDWQPVLHELAGRAVARQPLAAHTVGWADGALLELSWDDRWPVQVAPDTTIAFARLARARPFVGTSVPVQVLLRTGAPVTLTAEANIGSRLWQGQPQQVEPGPGAQAFAIDLPLPGDLVPDAPVAIELRVLAGGEDRALPLGTVTPAACSTRP